jgi:hypothetical protein
MELESELTCTKKNIKLIFKLIIILIIMYKLIDFKTVIL